MLLNAANSQSTDIEPDVQEFLKQDIDCSRLQMQLSMISDMIKTAFSDHPISKITNVRTIADATNQSSIYKSMLSELDKCLKIFFSFPVTSATAERSFSSLRRIKTFIRSTMSDSRLNNLFLLYVHVCRTDALDLKKVASEFVSVNIRRKNYFGTF